MTGLALLRFEPSADVGTSDERRCMRLRIARAGVAGRVAPLNDADAGMPGPSAVMRQVVVDVVAVAITASGCLHRISLGDCNVFELPPRLRVSTSRD